LNKTELREKRSLTKRLGKLYVAAISDILDDSGFNHQVMDSTIRPLHPRLKLAGIAVTVTTKWYSTVKKLDAWDYGPLFRVFDAIYPGCALVLATNGRTETACWGELISNAARKKGAVGLVTDGAVRDVEKIIGVTPPFQVFAASFVPTRMEGRSDYDDVNTPVSTGGVRVDPGDIIFGDMDGVVVIPGEVAEKTINTAEDTAIREAGFRSDVRKGMDVRAAIDKYGVA
jgi:4-hydroxy-4-methyl-2-oxoglutarate aldolase